MIISDKTYKTERRMPEMHLISDNYYVKQVPHKAISAKVSEVFASHCLTVGEAMDVLKYIKKMLKKYGKRTVILGLKDLPKNKRGTGEQCGNNGGSDCEIG